MWLITHLPASGSFQHISLHTPSQIFLPYVLSALARALLEPV